MFKLTLKNLSARKLRLLTTSFAVLLGVAFMAGTLVLTDTLDKSLSGTVAGANAGTDVNVRGELAFDDELMGEQRARVDVSLIDAISSVDGVAAAEGHIEAFAQVVDKDGEPMGNPDMGAPVIGGEWLANETLNPFTLAEGRAPEGDHEVVIDDATADTGELAVGDQITVLTEAGPQAVTVAGIAELDDGVSLGGAQVTMFSPSAAQAVLTEPGKVDAIKVLAEDGVSQRELADRIEASVPKGMDVLTGAELVKEEQDSLKADMAFFNTFLLVFAVIALFVGSFIIYNSFSILVAQRSKEMALMRAIGAGRRQVMGAVVLEAAVVGLIASVLGLAAGIGVAAGLQAMLNGMGLDLPAGGIVLTNKAIVASLVAGLGVSVASSVFPARRASKIAPVAAMRDVALDSSASSKRRVVVGTAVTGLGALAMASGLFGGGGVGLIGLGAPIVFIGVAILGPVLARPISRIIGAPLPRLKGMSGTIARENAMRNPKRTSATAAALMIGVALVGMITILAASTKASVDEAITKDFHGDLVIAADAGMGTGGLSTDLAAQLQELPELDAVTGYRIAATEVDGKGTTLLAADPLATEQIGDLRVTGGSAADIVAGTIAVDEDVAEENGWSVGDALPVRFAETGVQRRTVGRRRPPRRRRPQRRVRAQRRDVRRLGSTPRPAARHPLGGPPLLGGTLPRHVALACPGDAPVSLRAEVTMWTSAVMSNAGTGLERAIELGERSLDLWTEAGDDAGLGEAAALAGGVHVIGGHRERAVELFDRSAELFAGRPGAWAEAIAASSAGRAATIRGDLIEAERLQRLCVERFEAAGALWASASINSDIALLAEMRGQLEPAMEATEKALEAARHLGLGLAEAQLLARLGNLTMADGQIDRAEALHDDALMRAEEMGAPMSVAYAMGSRAMARRRRGDLAEARAAAEYALALWHSMEVPTHVALSLATLGFVAEREGDLDGARQRHEEVVALGRTGDGRALALGLDGLAGVASAAGDAQRAAQLLGRASQVRVEAGGVLAQPWSDAPRIELAARAALGDEAFDAAYAGGATATVDELLDA